MCSYSDIVLYGLGVLLDLVSKLVDRFEGGFSTDRSEVSLLQKGVLIVVVVVVVFVCLDTGMCGVSES